MSVVGTVKQQPNDVQDYDIDFSDWFPTDDVIVSATMAVIPSMPIPPTYAIKHPRVKIWIYEGGISGTVYKVTLAVKTNDGRVKEIELKVKIKDY